MIRIKIPFQFKVYLVIFMLFAILLPLTTSLVNRIVSNQFLQGEKIEFEGLKTLFYNLLRSKIEALENEALLLADQSYLRKSLEMLDEGKLVESFLISSFPRSDRRELVLVTDNQGKVVDGRITLWNGVEMNHIRDVTELQPYINKLSELQEVLQQIDTTSYAMVEDTLFAISSIPVMDTKLGENVIGTVTLGFPVDKNFALDLRSGSRFHIGFILGNRVITSSLDADRARDLSFAWDRTLPSIRQAMLDRPIELMLYDEKYLVYASPLPVPHNNQGLYVILSSLEDTYRTLRQLQKSIIYVSMVILLGTLSVGYILARGVTAPIKNLAETISRVAEGDYTVDAALRTGDELETLGGEINYMAQTLRRRETEIKEYVRQIEEWNKELESKVAERTKDLEEKNFRLRTISKELGQAYAKIDDELKVVGELQKKLLPDLSLDLEGLSIRSFYLPNGRAGGDYYDFLSSDKQQLFFLIADVSGHGTPAAFIMGTTRATSHALLPRMHSPAETLTSLNNILKASLRTGEYVTMFLGRLDIEAYELTYSVAGHIPPLLLRKDSEEVVELGVNRGLPLGIVENPEYEEVQIKIEPGDRLLLYTDGIIETFNDRKDAYGLERLQKVLKKSAGDQPEDLLDEIIRELEEFINRPLDVDPLEDDVTLVAIDIKPVKDASAST